MIRLGIKYLFYRIFARHRRGHGIHSPFVYSFIRNVLLKKGKEENLSKILEWHNEVSNSFLPVGDNSFGAGTRLSQHKKRKRIKSSRIGIPQKYGIMLYRLVQFSVPGRIIEMGTGSGISTAYLAGANPAIQVLTLEGNKERQEFAKKEIEKLKFENIEFLNIDFDNFINAKNDFKNPLLVFIDGNHRYEPTMRYYQYFSSIAVENTVLIFDDIRWSGEMEKCWKRIKSDVKVTISIDLFFMGIVFFKPGITKQDFIINF